MAIMICFKFVKLLFMSNDIVFLSIKVNQLEMRIWSLQTNS